LSTIPGAEIAASQKQTAQTIREAGGEAVFVRTDISSPAEVQAMIRCAEESFGGLDCAVNNAVRFIDRQPLADISEEDWAATCSVNITGTFLCMKYEIRAMLEHGGGAIVNIGSGRENAGEAGLSWYLGAKQAIYGMSRCAAADYAEKGLRINAVAPGPMWTPALREKNLERMAEANGWPDDYETREARFMDLGIFACTSERFGRPADIGTMVAFLASPLSAFVNGANYRVDGGQVQSVN